VVRAVHRLEHILLALFRRVDGLERVLSVFCPVTRSYIKSLVANMGRYHLHIAILFLDFAQELLQAVAQGRAFGQPQRKALPNSVGEREKFHLLAEFAVVALLGFLEQDKILVEHLLLGERNAVYAHELLAFLVSAPVCACKGKDFDGLYRGGGGKVWPAAEVGEGSLCICGDMSVLKFAYEFALVVFATVAEHLERVGFGNVGTAYLFLFANKLHHLLLDFREVFRCDLVFSRVDVIIEAVFDCRADTELHAWIKLLKGFGEKVC
jgi:hypothetical protein